jgi:hypothetical protein
LRAHVTTKIFLMNTGVPSTEHPVVSVFLSSALSTDNSSP